MCFLGARTEASSRTVSWHGGQSRRTLAGEVEVDWRVGSAETSYDAGTYNFDWFIFVLLISVHFMYSFCLIIYHMSHKIGGREERQREDVLTILTGFIIQYFGDNSLYWLIDISSEWVSERERDRQRETERQRQRRTDRQTDRQTDRERERERERTNERTNSLLTRVKE